MKHTKFSLSISLILAPLVLFVSYCREPSPKQGSTTDTSTAKQVSVSSTKNDQFCNPKFLPLLERQVQVRLGLIEVNGIAVVIGCEGQIRTITPKELDNIAEDISSYLSSVKRFPSEAMHDLTLRVELSERINMRLGRRVVSDLFFFHISKIEYGYG